jgi:hypothetical protein
MMNDAAMYLSVFTAKCGHEWIGSGQGSFACPVCGLHDGDHHLISVDEFPVQVNDWGCSWCNGKEPKSKWWGKAGRRNKEPCECRTASSDWPARQRDATCRSCAIRRRDGE